MKPKCSVLIIDDDDIDRYMLDRLLKQLDIDVKTYEADTGQAGIDFLTNYYANPYELEITHPLKIIFLDINMPVKNGFEFLEEYEGMQKAVQMKDLAVIMYTSSEREDEKREALEHKNVVDFLPKGLCEKNFLMNKIKPFLDNNAAL